MTYQNVTNQKACLAGEETMSISVLEMKNVRKSFGSLEVLKDISLNVKEGEVVSILGPSGSGKSTLLRCFNGLESFQKGEVVVDGKAISSLDKKQLSFVQKEMGMIFQNFNLLNRLNVYDNIALPLKFWKQDPNSKENKQRIENLLKLVGLEEKRHAYPRQLSGGQKQRVAIARALVLNPKILLCDEATSALDPQITRDILNLLLKINKEMNITIVVVTHQMEVIKQICNKVAFLKDGRVLSVGKPEELFVAPNQEIQKFVGDDVEILPQTGKNIKLFFTNNNSKSHTITQLARTLDINFDICQGKLENFRVELNLLQKNKPILLKSIGLNVLKLTVLYSIPFFCSLAMNVPLSWKHFFDLIGITAFVYLISDFVPLPGASGGSEGAFFILLRYFLKNATSATLLVWRFATYYAGLIIGGLTMSFSKELNIATLKESNQPIEENGIVIEDIEEVELKDFKK
mgnify:CR=1 FL=1